MEDSGKGRTILLTGASGVIGQALLKQLENYNWSVTCLSYRTLAATRGVDTIVGDVTRPKLGLTPLAYADLTARIDAVVHAAAVTDLSQPDEVIERTNLIGTEAILELCASAAASLYHVSTAFIHPVTGNDDGATRQPDAYERSKRAADRLVAESGLPHTIVRPSIVVGDGRTGVTSRFQGLHLIAGATLTGALPVLPARPSALVDFVPRDTVAHALVALIDEDQLGGEYWLTAGAGAPTLSRLTALCVRHAPRLTGWPITAPRMVPLAAMRPNDRRSRALTMAARLAPYFDRTAPLPSSMPDLCQRGLIPPPDPEQVFVRNLEYWSAATGRLPGSGRAGRRAAITMETQVA
jgi:nucleoside-diphosphate-sugar epimerase